MKRLEEILNARGISYSELARSLKITQPAISSIVRKGTTGLKTAIEIAEYLDCSLDYLCGLDDDKLNDKRVSRLKSRLHKAIDNA